MHTSSAISSSGDELSINDQENVSMAQLPNSVAIETLDSGSKKQRKPPTVTPRRFTRFFTPRNSAIPTQRTPSRAARQLRDITKNGRNRCHSPSGLPTLDRDATCDLQNERPTKRRRRASSILVTSSPPRSSPIKYVNLNSHAGLVSPIWDLDDDVEDKDQAVEDHNDAVQRDLQHMDDIAHVEQEEKFCAPAAHKPRVRQLLRGGSTMRILQRSFGGHHSCNNSWKGADHCADWRQETSAFVSSPRDCHTFQGSALPFCVVKCNTNSLIAVGQEEGGVRLIDTATTADFAKAHVQFRPHRNAIIDLAFNSDDRLLATASGDQTARIIDMAGQQTACILSGHTSSVKQVRWQPGTDSILTTSSRDGSLMLWDLRCGAKSSVLSLRTHLARSVSVDTVVEPLVKYATGAIRVGNAHRSVASFAVNKMAKPATNEDTNVSVTAFQYLPNGRQHLLVSASEVNASLKLWDLRNAGRRQQAIPLSATPLPADHHRTRNYGVNSLVLSGDGSRLYSLCRDATVYVYSTNHLALGSPPEMQLPPSRRRSPNEQREGLGPLYALKHQALQTGSFYIKASLRQANGDQGEMLAVGSTNKCAVLFPTDERFVNTHTACSARDSLQGQGDDVAVNAQARSATNVKGTATNRLGSALVRAHAKEVTSLCWSYNGDLVTVSDDMKARCWRQDDYTAKHLRTCGESGGQRWNYGWAEMDSEEWDDSD